MKKLINNLHFAWQVLLTPALLLVAAIVLSGCSRRTYYIDLQDQEPITIGSDVQLDGKKIGTVTEITRNDGATPGRAAKFVVTVPGITLKAGTMREEVGTMRLSSASCPQDAPILESGSRLPTRAPIANFARSAVKGTFERAYELYFLHPALAVLVPLLAAGVLLYLLRASFRRKACLILPLCLLAISSSVSAADTGFTRQSLMAEQQQYEDSLQRARAEINTAKERNIAGLAGLAEAPLVTAAIILDRLQAEMTGHEDRIAAIRRSPLSYNREKEIARLTGTAREQESRRARMADEIQTLCLSQGPTLTNTWPGATLYFSKRKDLALAFAKPGALEDVIRALQTGYPPAPLLSATLGPDSTQGKPAPAAPAATATTNKVIEYLTLTNTVIITNHDSLVLERPSTNALDISRQLDLLRQQGSNIAAGLAALTSNPPPAITPAADSAPTHQATLASSNRNAQPHPARPPPDTNSRTPQQAGITTNNGATSGHVLVGPPISKPAATNVPPVVALAHPSQTPHQTPQIPRVAIVGAALLVLAGLLLLCLAAYARKRPMKMYLNDPAGHEHEVMLFGSDDVALLRIPPVAAPVALRGTETAIGRNRLGRPILLSSLEATVNGAPASAHHRLRPGDEVILPLPDGPATWSFGGLTALETPSLETEPETIS